MQDSHAYLEGGHHLDPPELQHLPESPVSNESCINKHHTSKIGSFTDRKCLCTENTLECKIQAFFDTTLCRLAYTDVSVKLAASILRAHVVQDSN